MAKTTKKEKNTVEGSEINAEGNVTIGDNKVINVYGLETNQEEIRLFARIFAILTVIFPLGALLFLMFPSISTKKWPIEFIPSFFCGAFFALCLLFLIFLLRTKNQSSINVK